MDEPIDTPEEVLAFWREAGPDSWFAKDDAFDAACRRRLGTLRDEAEAGRLAPWEETPDGALALVILLDQIPRNIFRGDRRTWATDPQALAVATRAVDRGFHHAVPAELRSFLFLPFEHAEDMGLQERSVALFREAGDADGLTWAEHHRDIVARFGRFPHRNAVLGRATTPEEARFLETDPFRG